MTRLHAAPDDINKEHSPSLSFESFYNIPDEVYPFLINFLKKNLYLIITKTRLRNHFVSCLIKNKNMRIEFSTCTDSHFRFWSYKPKPQPFIEKRIYPLLENKTCIARTFNLNGEPIPYTKSKQDSYFIKRGPTQYHYYEIHPDQLWDDIDSFGSLRKHWNVSFDQEGLQNCFSSSLERGDLPNFDLNHILSLLDTLERIR